VLGETRHQQAGDETGQAQPQRTRRAQPVAPAPGQGHADHAGGQGAAEGERIQAQPVQLVRDGGHGGGDCERFECMQRDQRDHADGGGAVARREDRRWCVGGRQ